eukprot:m.63309 g.63309  ORF g.63309 m.63309 type:complete len:167 (-) comp23264_c1_seq1:84-584(-)
MASIKIVSMTLEHLDAAFVLEQEGFPADEAGSLANMRYRIVEAPELQIAALDDEGKLVGYILSTRAHGATLTHDSMEEHQKTGESVCLHSVNVAKSHQRKGIASTLLKHYLDVLIPGLTVPAARALLISHPNVVPLYVKAGFVDKGLSSVVHGDLPWNECEAVFGN